MPMDIRNLEWLSLNAQRAYPLAEGVSALDVSGTVKLPTSLIVDIDIATNSIGVDTTKFYIFGVSVFSSGVVILIGYDGTQIGAASISSIAFTDNTTYNILFSGNFADARGTITIGNLFNTMDVIHGAFRFNIDTARLTPSTIKQGLKNVNGIIIRDTDLLSELYQGDIVLKAGAHVTLDTLILDDTTTEITINAIPGEGQLPPNYNLNESGTTIKPLLTINGITPNDFGNFTFEGDNCLNITAQNGKVTIDNNCSSPCCDCDSLNALKEELDLVRGVVDAINTESGRLAAEVQSVAINLVTSILEGPPTEVARMVDIMTALLDNADVSADCIQACPEEEP